MKITITLLLTVFFSLSNLFSNIIYVKEGANGNGSSWAQATGDLQNALTNASAGTQIWVAAGTFFPTDCEICSDQQRNISFVIPNGVEVYGGFSGSEVRLSQRKWRKNATTLSGNIGRADVFDNSFTVVLTQNTNNTTVVDGFIIADGYADNSSANGNPIGTGAGLYNDGSHGSSNPTIRNCIFMYNQATEGAAIFNNGSNGEASPTMENCSFVSNKAVQGGGAIFNYAVSGKSEMNAINCQFVGNEASVGGGIFSVAAKDGNCSPYFTNCKFVTNKAEFGGGIFYLGDQNEAQPQLEACSFLNNYASDGPDWFTQKGEQLSIDLRNRLADRGSRNL